MGKNTKKVGVLVLSCFLSAATAVMAADQGRIVSQGDIALYQGNAMISRVTGKNIINNGYMMVCNGDCLIKGQGISLTAAKGTGIGVRQTADKFQLFVRNGQVDFVVTDMRRRITFITPNGVYSPADMAVKASTSAVVKGYVRVTDKGTEVGLREGKMTLTGANGMKTLNPDDHVILAMAEVPVPAAPAADGAAAPPSAAGNAGESGASGEGGAGWWNNLPYGGKALIVAGGIGAAVSTGVIISNNSESSSKKTSASPSQ